MPQRTSCWRDHNFVLAPSAHSPALPLDSCRPTTVVVRDSEGNPDTVLLVVHLCSKLTASIMQQIRLTVQVKGFCVQQQALVKNKTDM